MSSKLLDLEEATDLTGATIYVVQGGVDKQADADEFINEPLEAIAGLEASVEDLQIKAHFASVRVVTTTNITISTALNNGDSIDGVTLATNDLVLVAGQTAPEENGIYVVGAVPARASSFDTYDDHPGVYVSVMEGTTYADTLWRCTSNKGGTLGTTALTFAQFVTDTSMIEADIDALQAKMEDLALWSAQLQLQVADNTNVALFLGSSGNRVADSFDATTYVDVAGATNLDTGTPGLLKATATGGPISGSTGTNIGNMTGQGGLAAAFNGVTNATAATNSAALTSVTNQAYVGKTYSPGRTISQVVVYGSNNNGFFSSANPDTTIELYGKTGSAPANASDGTLLGSVTFTDTADESAGRTITSSDTTTVFDHVWMRLTQSGAAATGYVAEVVFHEPTLTNDLTVRSSTFTAASAPTAMKALILVKEVDAATAGTDYTLECSRDGGTTWSTMTLTELFTSASPTASIRVVEAAETDVSGQPSGTSPRWRFKTLNNKNVELHDVYFYWS
jgi:hypothetical protein